MSESGLLAEADGNRTRQRQDLPLSDFEDRAGHQTGNASLAHDDIIAGSMEPMTYRLTQYAHGGGCACKIPPGAPAGC
jgi:selenide, water dikinase